MPQNSHLVPYLAARAKFHLCLQFWAFMQPVEQAVDHGVTFQDLVFLPGKGASPAYVLDTSDERHTWQYVMPRDATAGCSRFGGGLGEYKPVESPKAVVAVVGSAHVGGIIREWPEADDLSKLSELLGVSAGQK